MLNPTLLSAALVTVSSYAGLFTAYTYIAAMLTQLSGVTAASVGIFMLVYGLFAAIGNILGGKITDSLGVNRANILIVDSIFIIAVGMWIFSGSAIMMGILVALLGMFTFGAVPALQVLFYHFWDFCCCLRKSPKVKCNLYTDDDDEMFKNMSWIEDYGSRLEGVNKLFHLHKKPLKMPSGVSCPRSNIVYLQRVM